MIIRRLPLSVIVLVCWLVGAALFGLFFVSRAVFNATQVFNSQSLQLFEGVGAKLLANEAVLESYAAYASVADPLDEAGERHFARQLMRRYPFIVALERLQQVRGSERPAFVFTQRQLSGQSFEIYGYDHDQDRLIANLPLKSDYYPIMFSEPAVVGGIKLRGLDISFSSYQRDALLRAKRHEHGASSKPFRLLEGDAGYFYIHPVRGLDTEGAGRSFVAMVIRNGVFAPSLPVPEGMEVRLWHRLFPESDPGARVFEQGSLQRTSLEGWLYPRLTIVRDLGGDEQQLRMRVSWQLGWAQIGWVEWGGVLLLSLAWLLILLFGMQRVQRWQHDRRASEERLFYLANHDRLTGLANRSLLQDRFIQSAARKHRLGGQLALVYLDLDRFKPVNDNFGHAAGDELLRQIGQRLGTLIRAGDTVARLGGDEFVVLLENVESEPAVHAVCARIEQTLSLPYDVGGEVVCIGASVGVAFYPDEGTSFDSLLAEADRQMYRVKQEHHQHDERTALGGPLL